MEELGEEVDRNHKDRTWCLLTPSPTLQRPHTLRLGTPRASSYGCCSPVAFISTSSLGQTHAHTHTHTHTTDTNTCVYTNACSTWGHRHKQRTQAHETPLFPVRVCVPMLSMCVYTCMCLHRTCLCVCVCVRVCVCPDYGRRRDEEQIQKHAHHFYLAIVFVWTGKRGYML